ncbi:MAG: hypothetical protein JO202_00500 [Ktedonobacteraceae bacterium]|nr:hypothetical protein [Ktedonobacteraceae bacterium]
MTSNKHNNTRPHGLLPWGVVGIDLAFSSAGGNDTALGVFVQVIDLLRGRPRAHVPRDCAPLDHATFRLLAAKSAFHAWVTPALLLLVRQIAYGVVLLASR